MTDHNLDRILAADDELIPSSGFLTAVMERVEQEAAAPAPIPFPWKRAVPGIVLAAGVLGWGGIELGRHGIEQIKGVTLAPPHIAVAFQLPLEQVGWVAIALGASLASWLFSRRLAGRAGLL
jgi:hypothetical protein